MFSRLLAPTWYRQPGSDAEKIRLAETELGVDLPQDYKEFLAWSDGGEGRVGDGYLSLWPVAKLAELNQDYGLPRYLPGLVAIGSDGGDNCIALDYGVGGAAPALVEVPFGDLSSNAVTVLGGSLAEGLALWLEPSVRIELSEPWELAGVRVEGRVTRRLAAPDGEAYWLINVSNANGVDLKRPYVIVTARYTHELLADLLRGQRVIVSIASVLDSDLKHQRRLEFHQVDYFALGSAVLFEPAI